RRQDFRLAGCQDRSSAAHKDGLQRLLLPFYVIQRRDSEPVTVADRLCALGIKNLERLLAVSLGVCDHFLMCQVWPRNGTAARVANHSREIPYDENRLMPEVLKFSQFSQHNRVPKVNIRSRRVHPKLDTQRPAQCKLLAQFAFIDDLSRALFQQGKCFVRLHAISIPSFRAKSRSPVAEAQSSFAG